MNPDYNVNNIFAKIIRGELPADFILKNDSFIAIADAFPKSKKHFLIIPKNPYLDFDDFSANSSIAEKLDLFSTINQVVDIKNMHSGHKIIMNSKKHGGQEVFHFHIHLLA